MRSDAYLFLCQRAIVDVYDRMLLLRCRYCILSACFFFHFKFFDVFAVAARLLFPVCVYAAQIVSKSNELYSIKCAFLCLDLY